jgi:hypothetical protein
MPESRRDGTLVAQDEVLGKEIKLIRVPQGRQFIAQIVDLP